MHINYPCTHYYYMLICYIVVSTVYARSSYIHPPLICGIYAHTNFLVAFDVGYQLTNCEVNHLFSGRRAIQRETGRRRVGRGKCSERVEQRWWLICVVHARKLYVGVLYWPEGPSFVHTTHISYIPRARTIIYIILTFVCLI